MIENRDYVDIGVAAPTDKGPAVPVIRNCDTLGMAGIEKAITDSATRAREGKITLADFEGGVFTITNGGTFGSLAPGTPDHQPAAERHPRDARDQRPPCAIGKDQTSSSAR